MTRALIDLCQIYETRGGPDHLRWFWSLTVDPPMARSDKVATLEDAKAQFETAWRQWLAWAEQQEMPSPRASLGR